jgi:hypothetical protein
LLECQLFGMVIFWFDWILPNFHSFDINTFLRVRVMAFKADTTIFQLYRGGQRPVASYWQTLSHTVVLSTPRHEQIRLLHWNTIFGTA